MTVDQIATILSAIAAPISALALYIAARHFRRLEISLTANANQMLVAHTFDMRRMLLEHRTINYLDTPSATQFAERQQHIFDGVLGNHVENVWVQKSLGFLTDEQWRAYDQLFGLYAIHHRGVMEGIASSGNYFEGLQEYVADILERTASAPT